MAPGFEQPLPVRSRLRVERSGEAGGGGRGIGGVSDGVLRLISGKMRGMCERLSAQAGWVMVG